MTNKMTFSFSMFISQIPVLKGQPFWFRLFRAGTLIFFLINLNAALADSATETWPEPVYFPQKTDGTPLMQPKILPVKPEKEKKGFWPFNRKQAESKPIPTEEQIVKVGPKEPPASPYPLIRLPMPVQTESGVISPGIYLIKPITEAAEGRIFLLSQRDRILLKFQTQPVSLPDANLDKEGTPSPLSKTDQKLPEPMKAETRLSDDKKTLRIQVTENGKTYESNWFPTATDRRPVLRY